MTALRRKLIEDLHLRGLAESTCHNYVRCCARFASRYRRSPSDLDKKHVRTFLLELINDRKLKPATYNVYAAALKFLYTHTLERPEVVAWVVPLKVRRDVPTILSGSEVERLLLELTSLRMRAIALAAYGAGLRVSEACNLQFDQIDRERMVIRVRGKGDKERYTVLPQRLLETLEEYWRQYRPKGPHFFPSGKPGKVIARDAVAKALNVAAAKAKIRKRVYPHVLRHSFATHAIESGTDIRVVQVLLGHASIRTTMRYVQVDRKQISHTKSPADCLPRVKAENKGTKSNNNARPPIKARMRQAATRASRQRVS